MPPKISKRPSAKASSKKKSTKHTDRSCYFVLDGNSKNKLIPVDKTTTALIKNNKEIGEFGFPYESSETGTWYYVNLWTMVQRNCHTSTERQIFEVPAAMLENVS